MLQNILKLNGAQQLTRKEQKSILGAGVSCVGVVCPPGQCCKGRFAQCVTPRPSEISCLSIAPSE